MNIELLKKRLDDQKVSVFMYSLDGKNQDEAYCIDENNGVWEVFYYERGNKNILSVHDNEHGACLALEKEILKDL